MTSWTLGAVGDVFLNRDDPAGAFRTCRDVLRGFDVLFGNCEGAFTDAPQFAPSSGWRVVSPTVQGAGLGDAGFDVMALANNHIVDAGHAGLADTVALLRGQGIRTVGAGRDLSEARRPAVVEAAGVRIGFLGFASVYQAGYEARASVPGLAALRVHSHYYIPDWDAYGRVEPGVRPEVRTFPYPEDMAVLADAVGALRREADIVVVSHHWGNAGDPYSITDYEKILGHASIDAGADIVLGHHHHYLRGIELYHGKPIFYGLGHFVFDLPGLDAALTPAEIARLKEMGPYAIYPRDGYPLSPFPPEARRTMIASFAFDGARLVASGFVPCMLDRENQARPLAPSDAAVAEVADHVRRATAEAGFDTRFTLAEDQSLARIVVG